MLLRVYDRKERRVRQTKSSLVSLGSNHRATAGYIALSPHNPCSCPPRPDTASCLWATLSIIPRFDKRLLRLVRIFLGADFLDSHFRAVLGEDDVLLLHLADAALRELIRVEVDLSKLRQ